MPKVEIAHDVYAALQRRAIPFEDDVNDVLRRLLRDDRSSNGHGPARLDGSVHAVRAIAPVATATTDNGYRAVDEDANDSGNVIVRRRAPAGITRWQCQCRNALTQLQHEGHIERIGDDLYRARADHMTG